MKFALLISLLCLSFTVVACGGGDGSTGTTDAPQAPPTSAKSIAERPQPKIRVPQGPPPKALVVKDIEEGFGAAIKPHTRISTHYVSVSYGSGKRGETRWGAPFTIEFGPGFEIKGWEKGLVGMKVGGRRELIIPSRLAYGQGALIYVIDLLSVK